MSEATEASSNFDEDLLSGYLDGALTQQDEQRVRLHLEESGESRRLLEELSAMRDASINTRFQTPEDRQWDEAARSAVSRGARGLGMAALAVWFAATVGYALWEVARQGDAWLEKALVFGGVGAVALIFASTLLDRLRDRRTDRYREVKK